MLVILVCSLAALVAGFVDSIAGGGGLITTPTMLIMGVPPHLLLGTNKFAATMGTALALVNFIRSRLVLWRIAGLGMVFALLGAYAGARLALHLAPEALGKILVLLLPVGLVFTILPKKERGESHTPMRGLVFWLFVPLVSLSVGVYDGFFGPGTGSIFILAFHWVLSMGLIQASATAKVFNLASNAGALVGFLCNGQVLFSLGIPMALCNMLGNWLGSRMVIRVGAQLVRKVLVVTLILLMLTLIWRYFLAG